MSVFIYNYVFIPLFRLAFGLGGLFNTKIKQGLQGRRGQWATIAQTMAGVEPMRPVLLIHCTSVGEWLQAEPVLTQIKTKNPGAFVVVSFFSPSGFNFVKENHPHIDLKIYLPLDTRSNAKRLFALLKPKLWLVSKFDVWPNHLLAAQARNIPAVMIAATLSASSKRTNPLVAPLYAKAYRAFSFIFAVAQPDKQRFLETYPYPEKIIVAGDTRYDSVYQRGQQAKQAGPVPIFEQTNGPVIIAGSLWPSDEKHFMPALIKIMHQHPHTKAILVPHELHEKHIAAIEKTLAEGNLTAERFTNFSQTPQATCQPQTRCAIVDTIGLLSRLYHGCQVAFVGGAFGPGVHNVMEPAVFAMPVLYGPKHLNSFEAIELFEQGGGFVVKNNQDIYNIINTFVTDANKRQQTGQAAQALIVNSQGATEKIYATLSKHYGLIS